MHLHRTCVTLALAHALGWIREDWGGEGWSGREIMGVCRIWWGLIVEDWACSRVGWLGMD
eukprot:9847541-Alexandrium_andersonii.AAC.1